ncbi:MAG: hypothetical protein V3T96_02830 [Thermodesulfobacteriota bacterium]
MKKLKKIIQRPRNPVVVPAKKRTSAGPMKAGKKWLHKKLREKDQEVVEKEVGELNRK